MNLIVRCPECQKEMDAIFCLHITNDGNIRFDCEFCKIKWMMFESQETVDPLKQLKKDNK